MIELNLLSPAEKKLLKDKKNFLLVKNIVFVISIFTIIIILSLLSTRIILSNYLSSINNDINKEKEQLEKTQQGSLEISIKDLNSQLNAIDNIQKDYTRWSKLFVDFNKIIPGGILINNMELNKNTMRFVIKGKAVKREILIQFYDNLKQFKYLKDITSPISNLLVKENIDFQFEGGLSDEIKNIN